MTDANIIRLNRHEGIGSSDAKRIVDGNWHQLYMEKVGLQQPEDLSGVFRVQLGIHTESFHLDWLERKYFCQIERPEVRYYHPDHAFMFAHLDGWHTGLQRPVETKHTNSNALLRDKAIYYMPQIQHVLAITGASYSLFSIIAGNDEPEWCEVARNQQYIDELIQLETSFWWHVENKVPPEITPTGSQAAIQKIGAVTLIDGLKPYDMDGNNEWANFAVDYAETKAAAATFEAAKAGLKALVPADASQASGHGIVIKRDKRGALRFS